MLMGQTRVFYSMSKDGLIPKIFSTVNPKTQTPAKSNLLFMVFVSLFAAFVPARVVGEMTSIGTLFAFVLVCAGVLVLQNKKDIPRGKFRTPYINSKYIFPLMILTGLILAFTVNKQSTIDFLANKEQINSPENIVTSLSKEESQKVYNFLSTLQKENSNNDIEKIL